MADRCDNAKCTNPAKWQIESTDPNLPGSWQLCVPCKLHYDAAHSIDPARSRRGAEELAVRGATPELLAQAREPHSAPVRRVPAERSRPGEPPGLSLRPTPAFERALSERQKAKLEWVEDQLRQRGHNFPDQQRQAEEPIPLTRDDIIERLNQRLARQEQERQQRQRERQERQRGRELGD